MIWKNRNIPALMSRDIVVLKKDYFRDSSTATATETVIPGVLPYLT